MKKIIVKCECCDLEIQETCELANFSRVIDGKTHTFCCRTCADQYKPGKAKAE
jgi:hypothetical protein